MNAMTVDGYSAKIDYARNSMCRFKTSPSP